VANAAEESRRLARLAEGLLLLASSDEGGMTLDRHPQAIRPVLRAAVAAADPAAASGVSLHLDAPPGLVAPIDALRLRQAVENLLHNAVRVAPPGTEVLVRAWADPAGVHIEVSDHGPGFPEDFLPHAFERFRRADAARARHDGGAGLGLAIVAAIAEAYGGTVEARNQTGSGAAVRLTLPALRSP
jgi:signal transduction histidine kinase